MMLFTGEDPGDSRDAAPKTPFPLFMVYRRSRCVGLPL